MVTVRQDVKLDYSDVLISPLGESNLDSRADVTLTRRFYSPKHRDKVITGTGLIAANMDTVGTIEMARVLMKHGIFCALHKFYKNSEIAAFRSENPEAFDNYVFVSTGITKADWNKLVEYTDLNGPPNLLCIDVANGYMAAFREFVTMIRTKFPTTLIMAGNVVTPERVQEIAKAGADIVKIGIGPGSVCTTRKMTGVGYPQLSAVMECAAAKGFQMTCADGGCTTPGDISKAFIAGADFVMLGGMLAGHDECGGTIITRNGKDYMRFYGMSSHLAMNLHSGGVKRYRASEGKEVLVPYRGPVENTILEILGGIRSTMTYIGARRISEMVGGADFIRVNRQLNNVFSQE